MTLTLSTTISFGNTADSIQTNIDLAGTLTLTSRFIPRTTYLASGRTREVFG